MVRTVLGTQHSGLYVITIAAVAAAFSGDGNLLLINFLLRISIVYIAVQKADRGFGYHKWDSPLTFLP